MIWVVNTNSSACHIYDYQKSPTQLTLIKELSHPQNRHKKSDYLTSDKAGRYKTEMSAASGWEPHTDPKVVEIEKFSREIAKELDHGRNQHNYEKLIVIAPPHMSGVLLEHLNKHVKELIVNTIQKDLQHLSKNELLDFLKINTKYQDK